MWVKRDPLGGGGRWMDPKHYLSQFHIKYNPSLNPANWTDQYLQKREHRLNPECPVMIGWMLESVVPGQRQTYVRNPYYWAVDSAGNQLPYIDRIEATIFQDPEVMKLQVTSGAADYLQGNQAPNFTLADVQTLRQSEARSGMELRFWDNGGGTGVIYFFNWNKQDPKWRALVRNSQFLKALSMGFNRTQIQQAIYFNTGELTTGTMSPKAIEYNIPGGREIYASWRDAASAFDPEKAKSMLDELGAAGRQRGRLPRVPGRQPAGDHPGLRGHAAAGRRCGAQERVHGRGTGTSIGIKTTLNPVAFTGNAYYDAWEADKLLTNAQWGVGDGPNHLVYPQWVVPIERQRFAPLNGNWYAVRGTPQENQAARPAAPGAHPAAGGARPGRSGRPAVGAVRPDQGGGRPHGPPPPGLGDDQDPRQRRPLLDRLGGQRADHRAGQAGPDERAQAEDLALSGFVGPWIHPTPAVYDPETWYWDNPAAH